MASDRPTDDELRAYLTTEEKAKGLSPGTWCFSLGWRDFELASRTIGPAAAREVLRLRGLLADRDREINELFNVISELKGERHGD